MGNEIKRAGKRIDRAFWLFWVVIIAMFFLLWITMRAQAQDSGGLMVFPFCGEQYMNQDEWHVWFGYSSDQAGVGTYVDSDQPGVSTTFNEVAPGVIYRAAETIIPFDQTSFRFGINTYFGDEFAHAEATVNDPANLPDCSAATNPDAGGLFTITKAAESGLLYTWEILDPNGNWGAIGGVVTPTEQDSDGNAFTRLVLGNDNTDHNPDNYRIAPLDG